MREPLDTSKPCPKCGYFNWYIQGKRRECRVCKKANKGKGYQIKEVDPAPISRILKEPKELTALMAANKEKQYCPKGHEYTPDNCYYQLSGKHKTATKRSCKKCKKIKNRLLRGQEPDPAWLLPDRPPRTWAEMLLDGEEDCATVEESADDNDLDEGEFSGWF